MNYYINSFFAFNSTLLSTVNFRTEIKLIFRINFTVAMKTHSIHYFSNCKFRKIVVVGGKHGTLDCKICDDDF